MFFMSQWNLSIALTGPALDGGSLEGWGWILCWGCFSVAKGKDKFIFHIQETPTQISQDTGKMSLP